MGKSASRGPSEEAGVVCRLEVATAGVLMRGRAGVTSPRPPSSLTCGADEGQLLDRGGAGRSGPPTWDSGRGAKQHSPGSL